MFLGPSRALGVWEGLPDHRANGSRGPQAPRRVLSSPSTSNSRKKPDASAGARSSYRGFFYGTLTLSVHIPLGSGISPLGDWLAWERLAIPWSLSERAVTRQAKLTVQRPLSPPRRWQVSNRGCGFRHRLSTWVQRPLCAVRGSAPEGWGTPTPTEPSPVLDEGSQSPQVSALISFPLILEPGSLSLVPLSVMLHHIPLQFLLKPPLKRCTRIAEHFRDGYKEGRGLDQVLPCFKWGQLDSFGTSTGADRRLEWKGNLGILYPRLGVPPNPCVCMPGMVRSLPHTRYMKYLNVHRESPRWTREYW